MTQLEAGEYIEERARSGGMASGDGSLAPGGGARRPDIFARIGIMRALNRHHVPEFNPKGKEPHWGGRKLKRDQ
jgi:hypothetical protein